MNFCSCKESESENMPSKLAQDAASQMEAKLFKGLPADELKSVIEWAEQNVKVKASRSTIFDEEAENDIPKFDLAELTFGRRLGMGGYCTVTEVKEILVPPTTRDPPLHTREHMAMACIREEGGPRYAVKKLSLSTLRDAEVLKKGLADIIIEARILAVIQHPNIIKFRGFAKCGYFDEGFFIVMDRLDVTLDKQIDRWKDEMKKCTGVLAKFSKKKQEALETLEDDKMSTCTGIASALEFLHSKNIMYRDLKPENLGFDIRGDVKLFDFGLSTELASAKKNSDGTYNLTAETGSLRYMAPEVGIGQPYNLSADVYSFGILLWQVKALKTPFQKMTPLVFKEYVVKGSLRPKIDHKAWSDVIIGLLENCWSGTISERPKFDSILESLREESYGITDTGGPGAMDVSTRSYHDFLKGSKI